MAALASDDLEKARRAAVESAERGYVPPSPSTRRVMESFLHENHQHLGMADAEDVETVLRTTDSASLDAVLTYIVGRPAHFDSEVDNLMTQVMIARLAHDQESETLPPTPAAARGMLSPPIVDIDDDTSDNDNGDGGDSGGEVTAAAVGVQKRSRHEFPEEEEEEHRTNGLKISVSSDAGTATQLQEIGSELLAMTPTADSDDIDDDIRDFLLKVNGRPPSRSFDARASQELRRKNEARQAVRAQSGTHDRGAVLQLGASAGPTSKASAEDVRIRKQRRKKNDLALSHLHLTMRQQLLDTEYAAVDGSDADGQASDRNADPSSAPGTDRGSEGRATGGGGGATYDGKSRAGTAPAEDRDEPRFARPKARAPANWESNSLSSLPEWMRTQKTQTVIMRKKHEELLASRKRQLQAQLREFDDLPETPGRDGPSAHLAASHQTLERSFKGSAYLDPRLAAGNRSGRRKSSPGVRLLPGPKERILTVPRSVTETMATVMRPSVSLTELELAPLVGARAQRVDPAAPTDQVVIPPGGRAPLSVPPSVVRTTARVERPGVRPKRLFVEPHVGVTAHPVDDGDDLNSGAGAALGVALSRGPLSIPSRVVAPDRRVERPGLALSRLSISSSNGALARPMAYLGRSASGGNLGRAIAAASLSAATRAATVAATKTAGSDVDAHSAPVGHGVVVPAGARGPLSVPAAVVTPTPRVRRDGLALGSLDLPVNAGVKARAVAGSPSHRTPPGARGPLSITRYVLEQTPRVERPGMAVGKLVIAAERGVDAHPLDSGISVPAAVREKTPRLRRPGFALGALDMSGTSSEGAAATPIGSGGSAGSGGCPVNVPAAVREETPRLRRPGFTLGALDMSGTSSEGAAATPIGSGGRTPVASVPAAVLEVTPRLRRPGFALGALDMGGAVASGAVATPIGAEASAGGGLPGNTSGSNILDLPPLSMGSGRASARRRARAASASRDASPAVPFGQQSGAPQQPSAGSDSDDLLDLDIDDDDADLFAFDDSSDDGDDGVGVSVVGGGGGGDGGIGGGPSGGHRHGLVSADGELNDEKFGLHMDKHGYTLVTDSFRRPSRYSRNVDASVLAKVKTTPGQVVLRGVAFEELERIGRIGSGAGGVVSKYLHKPTEQLVAVKTISLVADPSIRKQIARELRTLHYCDSPHLTRFRGAFFRAGEVMIVMEFMDCGNLRELYYRAGAVPEAVVRTVADSITRGLAYLKSALNVMHRDVKPENVLVNLAGQVKLCDLGVSNELHDSKADTVVGTQVYLAPERAQRQGGEPAPYTVKADIWCMGIVLCEMALGRFPFPLQDDDAEDAVPPTEGQPLPRPSFLELFDWLDADTPSPSLPASRFSDECRAFVDACLEKQTEDRASFDALLAHDFLEGKAAADAADGFSMKAWIRGVYANRNAERVRDIRQHPWRYSAEDKAEVFGSDDPNSGSGPGGLVDDDDSEMSGDLSGGSDDAVVRFGHRRRSSVVHMKKKLGKRSNTTTDLFSADTGFPTAHHHHHHHRP